MNTNIAKPKLLQQLRNPNAQLWRQVKAAASLEGKTMTQWVEEALSKQLALIEEAKKEAK